MAWWPYANSLSQSSFSLRWRSLCSRTPPGAVATPSVACQMEAVECPIFPSHVGDPRLGRQRPPCRALQPLVRGELAPVPVDVLPEPAKQIPKLAALDLVIEVGHLGSDLLHQLRADDVAQRVAGKLREADKRPVDVLQDSLTIVGYIEAEVRLERLVPRLGQIANLESAVEHVVLQLESQQDVKVVSDLVRLDPDERRVRLVDRAVERLGIDALERLGKRPLQAREEVIPERKAASDQVLPQPRLRLVHARRGAVPQVGSVEVAPDALEVHPMAGLVDRTEEAFVEEVAINARRDADVAWTERDAKRMRGDVLPAALEVVTELRDRLQCVRELLVGSESTPQHAVIDRFGPS